LKRSGGAISFGQIRVYFLSAEPSRKRPDENAGEAIGMHPKAFGIFLCGHVSTRFFFAIFPMD